LELVIHADYYSILDNCVFITEFSLLLMLV
jgi:hypothetical protein